MMVARRAPGPAYANLQWRKPREGIRQAMRRGLSYRESSIPRNFAFVAEGFRRTSASNMCTTLALWHKDY
jgi:hypothetical protein